MTIEEAKKKILADDQFVLSELEKVQVLFELKKVIRYHFEREEMIDTESVAEHVYAMHVLINYFLPLEDPKGKLDLVRLYKMAQYHDIDEIVTGDMIGYLKTDADRAREFEAQKVVLGKLPDSMRSEVEKILIEYEAQQTPEAKFVKAIDRIEPTFHLLNENGKRICVHHKPKREQHRAIKEPYTKPYPCIYRFFKVADQKMADEGFFAEDNN